MTALVQFAGVGFAVLGVAYVALPRRVHRFGFDFLRGSRSEGSEPSRAVVWAYRFIGVCLVALGLSYLF
ncbi:hypothetical protein [Halopelagius inordinatus]|uniref:hypothetical protein n=1 Tax=Halopelagius inordinatus TaxID=553467 RepID=UPI001FE24C06|nr:hypothetical protein [Halopelagius inordinatus]